MERQRNTKPKYMVSKAIKIGVFALLALCVVGCKQKEWVDWKTQNTIWLEQNKNNPDVQVTPSGRQYKVITAGNPTDARPNANSTVNVTYTLKLINGYVIEQGTSSFSLSGVIKGFAEGVRMMRGGNQAEYEFYIPYDLGYGSDGSGTEGYSNFIPPYSTLIYRVHLNAIL